MKYRGKGKEIQLLPEQVKARTEIRWLTCGKASWTRNRKCFHVKVKIAQQSQLDYSVGAKCYRAVERQGTCGNIKACMSVFYMYEGLHGEGYLHIEKD